MVSMILWMAVAAAFFFMGYKARRDLTKDMVTWVTNDNGELGVKVEDKFFFLYKGQSLVYENGLHDNGKPIQWRAVFKREFGETCKPWVGIELKQFGNIINPRNIEFPIDYVGYYGESREVWSALPGNQDD